MDNQQQRHSHRFLHLPLRPQHRRHGGLPGGGQIRREAARRGPLPRLQIHVLRPGPGADPEGHPGAQAQPHRRGLLLAAAARAHLPRRRRSGRAQSRSSSTWSTSASTTPGCTPTARRPPKRPRPWPGRHRARGPPPGARSQEGAHPPRRAGRRRRHRGHSRGPDPGQRRQEGLPGRARALHRRPHGEVRQDLPDPRLRGLHPDARRCPRSARTRTSRSGPTPR